MRFLAILTALVYVAYFAVLLCGVCLGEVFGRKYRRAWEQSRGLLEWWMGLLFIAHLAAALARR